MGVQRQYTGTAGRIENAQVAVYLVYATTSAYAFIDRELYLPKSWTTDADRCAAAGVPAEVAFATKPSLARVMIERAVAAGTPAAWVTGDEVYGADARLRAAIAATGLGYVLAVAKNHRITTGIGVRRAIDLAVRADLVWQRVSAGTGVKASASTTGRGWRPPTQMSRPQGALPADPPLVRSSTFYRAWSARPVCWGAGQGRGKPLEGREGSRPARNSPPWTSTR